MIRVDRIIPGVLSDAIRKAPLCPEKIEFAWRAAVGPAVARVTNVRLDGEGLLHVTAADARWSHEVTRESRLILARLAALLGDGVVKRLRV